MPNLSEKDHGIFRHIVYGVVENLFYLDYIIQKYSKIKINKIEKNIINVLRIGVYELTFLSSKPYAVINEAVKIAKKTNYRTRGFVNAILRNIDRNLEEAKSISEDDFKSYDDYLSVKYSTNKDIINYLKSNYENYKEIIESYVKKPSLSIRVNTNLISKAKLIEKLESNDLIVEDSKISRDSLIVINPVNITDLDEFKEGLFTIQDQASSLVSEVLNPSIGSKVLDLCAAPGSKSTHLLQIMEDKGNLVANDIAENKLEKIKENFERLKLKNYEIKNYDAAVFVKEFKDEFDYVLVDAPCSGLGVVKRKPEIKLNRTLKDIKSLAEIQKSILTNAYNYIKAGGYLVYSTCTLGEIENQNIIKHFLEQNKDMEIVQIDGKDYKEILPSDDNDGFFIVKMLKMA